MLPSAYQQAIYDWIECGTGHAVVDAVAGAGKTTVLIEGARRLRTSNACFLAFNKIIAEEIATRLQAMGSPMQASTIHRLGKYCLSQTRKVRIEQSKYLKLCRTYIQEMPEREMFLKETPEGTAVKHLRTLVNFAQLTLTEPTEANLLGLIEHYALDDLQPLIVGHAPLWEAIWQGVGNVIEAGKEEYRQRGIIDFNDMVFLPTVLGLPTPHFTFLFIDEAQDLNRAQLELVLACRSPQGRLLFVGDARQCQPAGTMVRLSDGATECPIEQLKPGDLVVTYSRPSQMFVKKGKVTDVATRHYDGLLYAIKAGEKQSACTDSHKWLVRWAKGDRETWITYLMKQGNRYRVGQTRMFLKPMKGSSNFDFGLASRARQEKAEAAWVLKVHDSLADSLVYEQMLSAKYGLPEVCFHESYGIKCFTQEMIDAIYNALPHLEERARQCLEDHGRKLEYPLYTRIDGMNGATNSERQRQGRSTLFETQACNLISGYMAIPVVPDEIHGKHYNDEMRRVVADSWQTIEVTSQPFSGPVYSLNIGKYHKYIADGLVTCNSIYGFSAADTASMKHIIAHTQATVLPLSICYRCPALPLQLAQQIYPSIQPSPTAERGIVEVISHTAFFQQVQPDEQGGCAVIGRCTAPLVSLCLKLLQHGKKAKVRGRDIGAGLLDMIEILRKSKRFRFALFLELLDDHRDAQLEILGDKPDNEMAIDAFLDKVETVVAFYQAYRDEALQQEAQASVEGFEAYISDFFSDEDDRQCILFSTIHKAKGLEFNVVYALPEKVPHPLAKNAWQYEQELNAEYVLLTRAKKALYFIGKLISNLELPSDEPPEPTPDVLPTLAVPMALDEPTVLAEAEAIVAILQEAGKKAGGRPKKQKERLQIKVSSDVAAYLRSLKGGDDGYSGYLEALIRSDPQFTRFLKPQQHPISCG